jgi:hypothetical protein
MHTRYSLDPIKIYATKREVNEYNYRLDRMGITEIGESRAMMMIIRDFYINNLENVSTDIDRMHMVPATYTRQSRAIRAHYRCQERIPHSHLTHPPSTSPIAFSTPITAPHALSTSIPIPLAAAVKP